MFFSNFLQVALYVGTEVEASAPDLESRKFLLVMQDAQIAHADMEDLIRKAMNQNYVPVVDDQNKIIGIITRKSIIEYCYEKLKKTSDAY